MKSLKQIEVFLVAAALSGGALIAAPVIYEPFDYEAGDLNTLSGASELGFDSPWIAPTVTATSVVIDGSLTYGSLPTLGGSVGNLSGNVNRFGGARTVTAAALSENGLLTDGATLWFSVIVGYDTGGNVTNSRLGFALANSQFSGSNFRYNINDEGGQLGTGLGLTLGRFPIPNQTNGVVTATQFRDAATGTGFAGNVFGTSSSSLYAAGEHGLIVGKIVWGAGNTDTIELYRPDSDLNIGDVISTLTVDVDQSTFDTITWARGDKVVMDEIRFGASYEDVIGSGTTGGANIAISRISYDPDADTVTLTWNSAPNASYIAKFSIDLINWDGDLGDNGLGVADDIISDDGDNITVTFDLTEFQIENIANLFFRIEEL